MIITITAVFFALLCHVYKIGLSRAILHAFTWVCLYYIYFFISGTTCADMELVVDIAVCLSFLCFSLVFLYFHQKAFRRSPRIMGVMWPGDLDIKPLKSWDSVALASIPLVYTFVLVYVRIAQTGSIEGALFGFYAVSRRAEALWLARLLGPLFSLSLFSILLLRIDELKYRNCLSRILLWISSLLILPVLSIRGTRSALVFVPIVILLADSCLNVRMGFKRHFRPAFLVTSILAIALVFTVTEVRGQAYESFSDMKNGIEDLGLTHIAKKGSWKLSRGGSIGDQVAFCLKYYGRELPFVYFHTPYAIAVNLIPRELWPNKPVGFGKILALENGFHPDNPTSLAAGLAGEGYANGGWLGIIALSLLFGAVCGISSGLAYGFFLYGNRVHLLLAMSLWQVARLFVRGGMLSAWSSIYKVVAISLLILVIKVLYFGRKSIRNIYDLSNSCRSYRPLEQPR